MASNNNRPEEQNAVEVLNENLTNVGRAVATNTRAIYVAFGALLIIAILTLGYIYLIHNPNRQKAYEALNQVEITAMGNDSIAAAAYAKVADKFSGTPAKLANLGAGEALYNLGKYKEAAARLEKFSSKDAVLDANAQALLGDCYVNLKQYDKAIDAFNDAISASKANPQIAPRVLLKKAVVFDEQKKYDKALECYETIEKDFPQFQLGNGIPLKAYIEREKARLGK